jgi:hypothetical protein
MTGKYDEKTEIDEKCLAIGRNQFLKINPILCLYRLL